MNKEEALEEVFWLGLRILKSDFIDAVDSITDISEYIKDNLV